MTNNNDQEPNRKRKNNQLTTGFEELQEDDWLTLSLSSSTPKPRRTAPANQPRLTEPANQPFSTLRFEELQEDDWLTLSLSSSTPNPRRTAPANQPFPSPLLPISLFPMPPPPPQTVQTLISQNPTPLPLQLSHSHTLFPFQQEVGPLQCGRRNPTQVPREGKSATVPAPFPWATNARATVHSLDYLVSEAKIHTITGDVQCRRCESQYEMGFNLERKFYDVAYFIWDNRDGMHDRAPAVWMNPVLPTCKFCENSVVRPIISEKKKEINWLFLLLGQMLGCCTLEQLKYFCKHTKNHRTGAKDRILYLTYLGLCKQLDPTGPFNVKS